MRHKLAALILLLAVAAFAAAAPTPPALAGGYGRLIGHTKAHGGSHAVDIGWGAKLSRRVTAPHGFTVVVKSNLRPGYFCSYPACRDANVHWDVACSRPGLVKSREGGMSGPGRRVGYPKLPFRSPRTCSIFVTATPNSYVGGTIEMWLYRK
jgi:hypothetical protein